MRNANTALRTLPRPLSRCPEEDMASVSSGIEIRVCPITIDEWMSSLKFDTSDFVSSGTSWDDEHVTFFSLFPAATIDHLAFTGVAAMRSNTITGTELLQVHKKVVLLQDLVSKALDGVVRGTI